MSKHTYTHSSIRFADLWRVLLLATPYACGFAVQALEPLGDDVYERRKFTFFSEDRKVTDSMVLIPAGEYPIGADQLEYERFWTEMGLKAVPGDRYKYGYRAERRREPKKHRAKLDAFYILKWEIPCDAYRSFLLETGHEGPALRYDFDGANKYLSITAWSGSNPPRGREDFPVEPVAPREAEAFCFWLSKKTGILHRLPTEEEWEAAYRGRDGRIFPWGETWGDFKFRSVAIMRPDGVGPNPWGTYSDFETQDCTPEGVGGMLGGLRELTCDSIGSYEGMREVIAKGFDYFYHRTLSGGVPCSTREIVAEDRAEAAVGFRYVIPVRNGSPQVFNESTYWEIVHPKPVE